MNLGLQSQVVIAYLAALGNKPGALDLADGVEGMLYGASNWSFVDSAVYKAKTPEQRLAWWASGAPLQLKFTSPSEGWGPQISGGVLDQAIINTVRGAYEAVYGKLNEAQEYVLGDIAKPVLPPAPPAPPAKPSGGSGLAIVGGLAALAVVVGVVVVATKKKGKR